jgi:hypothetical protein
MATLSTTARGIGVSRREMLAVFGKEGSGFTFETSTDVSGLPRVVGTFEFDLIVVEFIGPEDDLVQASLHVLASEEHSGYGAAQALYLIAFSQLALPDWEGSVTWVRNNLPQAWQEGEVRTARGGVQFTLRATTEPETITVIAAAGP